MPVFNKRHSRSGFSLMEIIIVILIISVLAAVGFPRYRLTVERTRAAEGVQILTALYNAQKAYFFENDSYTTNMDDLDISFDIDSQNFGAIDSTNLADGSGDGRVAELTRTGGPFTYTLYITNVGTIDCENPGAGITCAQLGF